MKHFFTGYQRYLPTRKSIPMLLAISGITLTLVLLLSVLSQQTRLNTQAQSLAAIEPETGVLSGAVTIGTDANASGGRYIEFGVDSPTSPPSVTPSTTSDVSVLDYGANPNDTVDDTTAIRNAMSAAAEKTLSFPKSTNGGSYLVSGTLAISNPITLLGDQSNIKKTNNGGLFVIQASNVTIKSLQMTGPGENANAGRAIDVVGTKSTWYRNISLTDNTISNWYGAITLQYVDGFTVNNNTISHIVYNGILSNVAQNGTIDGNTIRDIGTIISGDGNAYGITMSRTHGNPADPTSSNVTISNNSVVNVPVWECYDTHGGANLIFRNNYCENALHAINIAFSGGGQSDPNALAPQNVIVEGNTIKKGPTFNESIIFAGTNFQKATGAIKANTTDYTNFGGAGIYVVNATITRCGNRGASGTVADSVCP